jgi:hypothetical protein
MSAQQEVLAAAARGVVEEGLDYGSAKQRALRALGLPRGTALPDNLALEDAVREHIALFCADTQPGELLALRRLALRWMDELAELRPHLVGAVWRGTATRLSPVRLQLFCDDPKAAELALLDRRLNFDVASERGPRGAEVDVLVLAQPCAELQDHVMLHLTVLDHDDLRGLLKPDARGRTQAGDAAALRRLLQAEAAAAAAADPAPSAGVAGTPGA